MGIRLRLRTSEAAEGAGSSLAWCFDQPRVVIGRSSGADVVVPDPRVSAVHATIEVRGSGYAIVDADSKNGTAVDGRRLVPGRPKTLRPGACVRLGGIELTVHIGPLAEDTTGADGSAALARRLVRELLDPEGVGGRPPTLRCIEGAGAGRVWTIPAAPARLRIGRDDGVEVSVPDPDASRVHAELLVEADGVVLEDAGSKNGLEVDGRRVSRARLGDGSEIVVGRSRLLFEDLAERLVVGEAGRSEDEVFDDPIPDLGPRPSTAGSHEPREDRAPSTPPPEAGPAPVPAPRAGSALGADLLVYALAAIILALSAAGLATLLR